MQPTGGIHGCWHHLNTIPDNPETLAEALQAAAFDMRTALTGPVPPGPALTTTVQPSTALGPAPSLVVRVGDGRTVLLSLPVLRRAATAGMSPVTLLACALAERDPLGDSWQPGRVGTGRPPAPGLIEAHGLGARTTSLTGKLDHSLEAGTDTVVCGNQGSGASELVAEWARARTMSGERGLVWLSPSDPADGAESIYETLLGMERCDGYLVVVDGVQSNPHTLHRIRACVEDLRLNMGLPVVLVATVWPSLVARLPSPFKGLRRIHADGAELVDLLLTEAQVTDEQREAFNVLVKGNVHLVVAALRLFAEDGEVPDRARLRWAVTGDTEDDRQQHALYWFACLGVFEIDVPRKLATRLFPPETLNALADRGLLWLSDGAYTLGTRARAGLVLERALAEWDAEHQWLDPARVVCGYLNIAGESTIIALLERMDLVGLIDNPEASEGTRYLAMTWDQRARLGRALAAHYVKGGNWNDCIGAAAFSAHVFAETNDITSWRVVADYIRNRFHYDGTALPAVVGDRTSDYADFPAIINAMSAMDKDDFTLLPGRELAHDIDSERFYLTWVLGLLLGFEGSALDHDQARVDSLLAIAEVVQDEGGGWFYPMRVPWVTARIVLGLCHAGQNYETSEVVRRACDWLRRPVAVGGALETWWRSGTRPWNTDEATTAMCLTALQRAGAPASPAVPTIMAWLLGQRAEWSREDHQVDLALVVEALLLYRTGGAELQEGVLALLQWALTVPDGGLPRVDTEIPEDNLRLPFVAAQLTVVIWATMMREFSAVIAHELRAYRPEIPAGGPTAPGGAAYDDAEPTRVVLEPGDVLAWRQAIDAVRVSLAAEINDRDRAKGTVVVNERRSELRARVKRLNDLTYEVSPFTPAHVLDELEAMGRAVCGDRWPHPPRPAGTAQ